MNATEAIELLVRAGREKDASEVVDSAATSAHAAYRTIQSDETRTDEYKREQMERVYDRVRGDVDAKLSKLAGSVKDKERRDVARVFGTEGVSGDAASLIISRRDAADRVAGVRRSEELRELLARATRSGDEVLARAVAEKAMEYRDADTLNAFLEDRPQLDEAVQRLWDAGQREDHSSIRSGFGATMALYSLRPPR